MKILKDSFLYLLGEIISKSIPFMILPYLTRSFGKEGYGELAYYLAITSFALIFVSLSQFAAMTRYYYVYGKKGMGFILFSGYLYSLLVMIPLLLYALINENILLIYSFLIALFQSLFQTQLSFRQCQKEVKSYFIIQVSLSIVNVGLTIFLFELFVGNKVELRLLSVLISYFALFCISFYFIQDKLYISSNLSYRKIKIGMTYILFYGFPLVFHSLSYTLKGQLDRFLIFNKFSTADLGVYVAGVQIASILSIIIMATNTALVPYLYEKLKEGCVQLNHIKRWFWLSLLFVPVPCLVVWLLPQWLFTMILGEGFSGSIYFTVVFLFAFALMVPYLLLVNYLFYHGKNSQIATCSLLSTGIYIMVLYYCSNIGIQFVPFASVTGNLIVLPLLYFLSVKVEKEYKNDKVR